MPIVEQPPGTGGGGSGTVTDVTSADTSIVVTNGTTTPDLQLATLDVIATNEPPAADWSNNSHKITALANGVGAQDATAYLQALRTPTRPTGSLAETFPRAALWGNNSGSAWMGTGKVSMIGIALPSGLTITSITFITGSVGVGSPTKQLFGIYDSSLNLLATSVDDGSTAWGNATAKTLNLTPGTFTTTYAGLHYLALMLVYSGGTPNLVANSSRTENIGIATILSGFSGSGLTSLPNPASALTASVLLPYAYIS